MKKPSLGISPRSGETKTVPSRRVRTVRNASLSRSEFASPVVRPNERRSGSENSTGAPLEVGLLPLVKSIDMSRLTAVFRSLAHEEMDA